MQIRESPSMKNADDAAMMNEPRALAFPKGLTGCTLIEDRGLRVIVENRGRRAENGEIEDRTISGGSAACDGFARARSLARSLARSPALKGGQLDGERASARVRALQR